MKFPFQPKSGADQYAGREIAAPGQGTSAGQDSRPGGTSAPNSQIGALPVFDVMPANAGRFVYQQETNVDYAEADLPVPLTVFDQVLPNGYVTDVQYFRCNVIDVAIGGTTDYLGIPPDAYTLTLYLNGAAEPFNQNISVYPLDGFYPCRIIGQGGQRVTITASFPWYATYHSVKIITCITGQMIVKNREQPQNAPLVQPGVRVQGT